MEKLKVSETIIVSFDFGTDDDAMLTVSKKEGGNISLVNTIRGFEAKDLYSRLMLGCPLYDCKSQKQHRVKYE